MAQTEIKKRKVDHTSDAPRELRVTELVQSHAKEIRALSFAINIPKNRAITQQVPHYMRRRAASHNIKRIPRKVRGGATQPKISTKPKKPSRYHRRRPKNLMEDFAKRQRRVRWMETHLWHAKRFHMIEKWGHRLAQCPTDKGERCAYRACTQRCLVQDLSYIQCMELVATKMVMLETLKTLIPAGQLEKGSIDEYTDGANIIYCTLYQPNQYPAGAVSPVEIMFNSQKKEDLHQIWVWCHTATYSTVWDILSVAFKVVSDSDSNLWKSEDGSVVLRSLKDKLIRFRFNGPQTIETLARVIKPVSTDPTADGAHVWWRNEFSDTLGEITQCLRTSLNSDYSFRCGAIASVRARDPRLCMTSIQAYMTTLKEKKAKETSDGTPHNSDREKIIPQEEDKKALDVGHEEMQQDVDDGAGEAELEQKGSVFLPHVSPLWSETVRQVVSHNMMSQQRINEFRSKQLVPGSEMELGSAENCVPLMLILNDKMVDLIMPASWGMAFWLAFAYAGAHAGGLREGHMVNFQTSRLNFPADFPDTKVCKQEELDQAKELSSKHFKYPPNKRPNFDQLCTNTPFRYDWHSLLNNEDPTVLRDIQTLRRLKQCCDLQEVQSYREFKVPETLSTVNLVPVYLSMLNRGVPEPRAEICLPSPADIADVTTGSSIYGPVLVRYNGKSKSRDSTHSTSSTDRLSTSRKIIGYVKTGRFSPDVGSALGHGFVTMQSLQTYFNCGDYMISRPGGESRGALCLIRAVDSTQYRFAFINIHVPAES